MALPICIQREVLPIPPRPNRSVMLFFGISFSRMYSVLISRQRISFHFKRESSRHEDRLSVLPWVLLLESSLLRRLFLEGPEVPQPD